MCLRCKEQENWRWRANTRPRRTSREDPPDILPSFLIFLDQFSHRWFSCDRKNLGCTMEKKVLMIQIFPWFRSSHLHMQELFFLFDYNRLKQNKICLVVFFSTTSTMHSQLRFFSVMSPSTNRIVFVPLLIFLWIKLSRHQPAFWCSWCTPRFWFQTDMVYDIILDKKMMKKKWVCFYIIWNWLKLLRSNPEQVHVLAGKHSKRKAASLPIELINLSRMGPLTSDGNGWLTPRLSSQLWHKQPNKD